MQDFARSGDAAMYSDDPRKLIAYFHKYEEIMPEKPVLSEEKLERQLAIASSGCDATSAGTSTYERGRAFGNLGQVREFHILWGPLCANN